MTKKYLQNTALTVLIVLAIISPFVVFWVNDFLFESEDTSEVMDEVSSSHDIRFHYSDRTNQCFIVTYDTFKFKPDVPVGIERIKCTDKVKKAAKENKSLLK